jgi:outer membrane protein assembly factor BamB
LDEPKSAGAFFLGPPLPVSGTLYVMAEVKGEIRLLAIDPETGRQEWSQQLAHVDINTIERDARRRLAGATPSYADGVLLCPTSAGAIVAVDVATRSLLWGYQYEPPPRAVRFGLAQRPFSGRSTDSNDHWQDASLTIDNGAVLVTPVDSNKLYCLDLQLTEATPRWTRKREDELAEALYVGCVHDGTAVIVGKHFVVGVLMDNEGVNAWEPIELDRAAGEMPSGRGFRSGEFYYLPTTSSRLLQIDVEQGKIVAAMDTDEPLGNLICYKQQVVSHSAGSVSCFYQVAPLREQVAARLQQSADDPWALARQGELFLHDGKNSEALQSLRRAHSVDPEDNAVQTLLVTTYLTALRKDFASHHELADEIERFIDLPQQQTEYLQLMASGYHKSGQLLKALEAYVKLVDIQPDAANGEQAGEPFLVKVEQDWSVRLDRWVRARLQELSASGDPPINERLTQLIQARVASETERDTQQLRRDVACFGFHSASSPLRFALVDRLIEAERFLEVEHLLNPLRNHPDSALAGTATARLAMLYMAATEYETAVATYRELGDRWPDVPVYQGKNGSELVDEAQADPTLELEFRRSDQWPWGSVKSNEKNAQTTESLSRLTSIPVEQSDINSRGAIAMGFDSRANSLVIRDGSGRTLFKTSVERSQPNGVDVAQFMGHQGFSFSGSDLIAVDTFRSTLAHNERGEAVRWRLNVAPPLESWRSEPRRTIPFSPNGVRLRSNFDPASKRAIFSIGPVNENGVFYQRLKKLICADPTTGATIWSRSDMEQGSTIFGDAEHLFVVADGADQAVVLRASDGRLLGERQLPAEALRWKLSNRHVLAWDEQGDRYRVYLRDIWTQADVWSEDLGNGTMGSITPDGHIALLQRNGRFVLRSMTDDRVLARTRLEGDEQLSGLRMFRFGPQYLVFAETSLPEFDARRSVRAGHQTNAALLTARLYAFDAQTGRNLWPIPAIIHSHGFAVFQPSNSPAIWFVRSVTTPQTLTSPQNAARSSLLCIDRRSGRIVFDKEDIPIQPSEFNITSNAGRRTSTFNLQGREFILAFTDEPTPPAPPAQTGSASSLADGDNRLADVAGSVFKALERQTPGADPFGEPE